MQCTDLHYLVSSRPPSSSFFLRSWIVLILCQSPTSNSPSSSSSATATTTPREISSSSSTVMETVQCNAVQHVAVRAKTRPWGWCGCHWHCILSPKMSSSWRAARPNVPTTCTPCSKGASSCTPPCPSPPRSPNEALLRLPDH